MNISWPRTIQGRGVQRPLEGTAASAVSEQFGAAPFTATRPEMIQGRLVQRRAEAIAATVILWQFTAALDWEQIVCLVWNVGGVLVGVRVGGKSTAQLLVQLCIQ